MFSSEGNINENSIAKVIAKKYPGLEIAKDRYQALQEALHEEKIDKAFEIMNFSKNQTEARNAYHLLKHKLFLIEFDKNNNKREELTSKLIPKITALMANERAYYYDKPCCNCCCNCCDYCSESNLGQPSLDPELSTLLDNDLHLKISRHNYPKTRREEFEKALNNCEHRKAFLILQYVYYREEFFSIMRLLSKKSVDAVSYQEEQKKEFQIIKTYIENLGGNFQKEILPLYYKNISECCTMGCGKVIHDCECGEVCCYC